MSETTVNVRYMVDDVEAAVEWYTKHLGFRFSATTLPLSRMSGGEPCGYC